MNNVRLTFLDGRTVRTSVPSTRLLIGVSTHQIKSERSNNHRQQWHQYNNTPTGLRFLLLSFGSGSGTFVLIFFKLSNIFIRNSKYVNVNYVT